MKIEIFKCDGCGSETRLPEEYDYRSGMAGFPVNGQRKCKACLDKDLLDGITKDQIREIKRLLKKCGSEDISHSLNSQAFCESKMRTQNISKLTKAEGNNIIESINASIKQEEKWKRDNPICAKKGCDWVSLGINGSECKRCGKWEV